MNDDTNTVELATDLTIAWLGNSNTRVAADDVPAFLQSMHDALLQLSNPTSAAFAEEPEREYTPATTARKSLASPEHIISMIDGKPYKTLRRHLSTNGMTPEEYRERYNLKADYPMVAQAYSEARRTMAKAIGLGRKAGVKIDNVQEKAEAAIEPVMKAARKGSKAAMAAAKEALGTGE